MSVRSANVSAQELVFHLFGRSVHPELLQTYSSLDVQQSNYSATVKICEAGHVVEFRFSGHTVTELISPGNTPLPQKNSFLERRLKGCRDERYELENGLCYQACYHLEQLEPDVYLNYHEELLLDCNRADLSYQFSTPNRLSPIPLSFLRIDATPDSLLVHSYHSFPDDFAVVKTQSLFEL